MSAICRLHGRSPSLGCGECWRVHQRVRRAAAPAGGDPFPELAELEKAVDRLRDIVAAERPAWATRARLARAKS